MRKRITSLLLVFVLLLGMMPTTLAASLESSQERTVTDIIDDGTMGSSLDNGSLMTTASAVQTKQVLYAEDFSDASALQDWTLQDTVTGTVSDGVMTLSNIGKNQEKTAFAQLTGVEGSQDWTNYTVEADMQYLQKTGRFAALAYNVTDADNHERAGIYDNVPNHYFVNCVVGAWNGWQHNDKPNNDTLTSGVLNGITDRAFRMKIETSNMTGTATGTAKFSLAPYGEDGQLGDWIEVVTVNNIHTNFYKGTIGIVLANGAGANITVDNIEVYKMVEAAPDPNPDPNPDPDLGSDAASEPETPAPATCKVTFNDNGHGTAPAALTGVLSGSTISKPADPVASGWIFGGWYKEADCANKWDFDTDKVAGDVTLFAKWTLAYNALNNAEDGAANRPNAALKGYKTGDLIDHNDGTMTQILYAEDFNSYVNAQEQRITTTNAVGGWILSANEKGDATATVELKDAAMYITPGSETNGNAHVQLNVGASKYWSNYTVEADFTKCSESKDDWMALAYNSTDRGNHQKGSMNGNRYALNGRVNNSWVNDGVNGENHNKGETGVVAPTTTNTTYRLKIETWGMSDTEPGHARLSIAYYNENGTLGEFTTLTEVNNIDKRTYRGSIGIALSSYGKTNAKVDNIIVYKNVYVLYEEDFSDEASLKDWTFSNAGQSLKNGKLYMNNMTSANAKKFGFAELTGVDGADQWDNYVVEADIEYVSDTQKRYCGLCYNFVGPENYQKASIGHKDNYNGYGINGRLNGKWMNDTGDNHKENPALGTIVKDGPFRLRIQTYNMTGRNTGTTSAYLARINADGSYGDWIEIATVNNITAEQCKGTIGIMLADNGGAEITVDNVLVYKGETAVPAPPAPANVAEIYVPTTGIVNPPVVVQEVTKALPLTGDLRPGVAMMQIDKDLNILSKTGETLAAIDQWFQTYRYLVIPAFIVDSQEEADALAAYLKKNNIIDVYVMAEGEADMGLVTSALSTWHYARGGLILDEVGDTEREWSVLWQKVNADTHITQIVSRKPVSVDAMTWFNIHVTALWGVAHSTADVYNAIASGYHAVVSESPRMVYDIYSSITATTVSGRPQPIAHRGAHMNYGTYTDAGNNNETGYPQNSREAFKLAIDTYGCLGVEADLHTTRDGVIFLEHDNDLSHYTNIQELIASDDPKYACFTSEKGYKHENYTMEELRMLTLFGNGNNKVGSITSFEDALAYTEATGLVYYCHIGDAVTRAEFDRILTDHPEYVDNCVIFEKDSRAVAQGGYNWRDMSAPIAITFAQTGNATAALYKTVDGKQVPLTDLESLEAFIKLMNPWNAHPLWYEYYHHLREDFYYEVAARGYITVHSITTGQTTLNDRFLTNLGMVAALIEQPYMTDDYHYYVDAGAPQVSMKVGEALDTTHTVLKVKGSEEAECGFVQLSGNMLTYDEGIDGWTSTTEGQTVIVYYADLTEDGGATYRVYSKPVTVTWGQGAPAASSDAALSALTVTGAAITPAFNAETLAYTASVANSVTSVTIDATANDSKATVSGAIGEQTLSVGANTFTVTVTAEDSATVKNYTITITRAAQQTEEPAKLLIDQVYGNGGKGETPIANSFVELYNPNDEAVSLDGYTLAYGDKSLDLTEGKSIPTKGSYLIMGASAGTTAEYQTYNLPEADQTCDWQISNKNYTITLKKGETVLDSVTADEDVDAIKVSKQKTLQRVDHADTDTNADFRIVVWEKGKMTATADTLAQYAPHNSKGECGSLVAAEPETPVYTPVKTSDTRVKGCYDATGSLKLELAGRYNSCAMNEKGGSLEIVQYNPVNGYAYAVSGVKGKLIAVNLNGSLDGNKVVALSGTEYDLIKETFDIAGFTYGDMTSVAISPDGSKLAVAIQAENYAAKGVVAIFTCKTDGSLELNGTYTVGVQPDMVTFADNNTILTADEGEPREGASGTDPKGSVSIVKIGGTVNTVTFDHLDAQRDELTKSGVLIQKNSPPSTDFEPEYIAVSGTTAYVALQEANAIAVLNIEKGEFTGVYPLGLQDYSKTKVDLQKNDTIELSNYKNVYGIKMPDGISVVTIGGKDYLLTANEGDSRADWAGLDNEYEGKTSPTGNVALSEEVVWFDATKWDGLDTDKAYVFGGRSFSIYEVTANGLVRTYDSGSDFEEITAEKLAAYFNCSNDKISLDNRSGKKGPEPESVVTGTVKNKTYAFIALERIGGVMVYDITVPANAKFVNYINSREFDAVIQGDVSPEGLCFVSAADSKTGIPLLLAACEVSGTMTVVQVETASSGGSSGGSSSGSTSNSSQYTIRAEAGQGGTISPNGSIRVERGGDQTFTVKAGSGYELKDVLVDGKSVGAVSRYTFENVRAAHTIKAVFRAMEETAENPFMDVAENAWYKAAVDYVHGAGLMNGISNAAFGPDITTTRGMIVTILYRMENTPAVSGVAVFSDVAADQYYTDAVAWASANGIVGGYGNGTFGPNDSITREQLVTMLWRYAGSPESSYALDSFQDQGEVAGYAATAMAWAVEHGIVSGTSATTLSPADASTRAQLATILMRFCADQMDI